VASKPPFASKLPLAWWLAGGEPLNPYAKGILIESIRKALKPKDLVLPPSELTFEGQRDNFEYTLYRGWIESWLKWLHWYCTLPLGYDPQIEELFEAPMAETSWHRRTFNEDYYKYGLLWKCFDILRDLNYSLFTCPPCLDGNVNQPNGWISGGRKGSAFIVSPITK